MLLALIYSFVIICDQSHEIRTSSNVTTVKVSYPKREFEPDNAFPLGAPRSSSPPLCSDTQIANAVHVARLVTSLWDQSKIIAANPVNGAKSFNAYLKTFIKTVLGVKGDSFNEVSGILGTVKAHYGSVEAQGRRSLHCHMLVWMEGALNPNEIRNKVMSDPEWGKDLLNYLDDTITNVVPEDPIPNMPALSDEKDSCALRGVDLNMENNSDRLALRMKDVSRLAERVQRYRHPHTCYKYYKPGEERTCWSDLKEENFCAESSIDSETGQISLQCLDVFVNNFNMTILEAVRCNMDIQFIGSGESAKAMICYITDYITKSQLKAHVAYAAL